MNPTIYKRAHSLDHFWVSDLPGHINCSDMWQCWLWNNEGGLFWSWCIQLSASNWWLSRELAQQGMQLKHGIIKAEFSYPSLHKSQGVLEIVNWLSSGCLHAFDLLDYCPGRKAAEKHTRIHSLALILAFAELQSHGFWLYDLGNVIYMPQTAWCLRLKVVAVCWQNKYCHAGDRKKNIVTILQEGGAEAISSAIQSKSFDIPSIIISWNYLVTIMLYFHSNGLDRI